MPNEETRLDKAAGRLAGGFATFTAVLAGAGAIGGGLERMIRNYPGESLLAFGLAVGSIVFATLAVGWFGPSTSGWIQTTLVVVSFATFAVALGVGTVAATQTPQLKERPRVAATLSNDGGTVVLEGTVAANGLKATDHFVVLVTGLALDAGASPEDKVIYWSRTGADASGAVALTLEVPVDSRFERVAVEGNVHESAEEEEGFRPGCRLETTRSGCAVLDVPAAASQAKQEGDAPESP